MWVFAGGPAAVLRRGEPLRRRLPPRLFFFPRPPPLRKARPRRLPRQGLGQPGGPRGLRTGDGDDAGVRAGPDPGSLRRGTARASGGESRTEGTAPGTPGMDTGPLLEPRLR